MFSKINPELLKDQEQNKTWYRDADNDCDLFVWENSGETITKFQLWYENFLLEWDIQSGLRSGRLDPEVGSFRSYQSPSYKYYQEFLFKPLNKILHFLQDTIITDRGESQNLEVINFVIQIVKKFQLENI